MSPLQADMVDEIKGLAFLLASPPLLSFLSMGHHRAVEAPSTGNRYFKAAPLPARYCAERRAN